MDFSGSPKPGMAVIDILLRFIWCTMGIEKWVKAGVALVCLCVTTVALGLSLEEAIERAGQQRMLSQRLVKDYALMGRGMLSAKVQLRRTAKLFSDNLAQLATAVETAEEKKVLGRIKRLWIAFDLLSKTKPNLDQAPQVNAIGDKMLQFSEQLVGLLEKRAGTHTGRLIALADRQKMLSQRIAKYYAFQAWGLETQDFHDQYLKALDEFGEALRLLRQAPENNDHLKQLLNAVEKKWQLFQVSFRLKKGQFVPSLVNRALDNIYDQMDEITAAYLAISR